MGVPGSGAAGQGRGGTPDRALRHGRVRAGLGVVAPWEPTVGAGGGECRLAQG